jgi:hypothetical protein
MGDRTRRGGWYGRRHDWRGGTGEEWAEAACAFTAYMLEKIIISVLWSGRTLIESNVF